MKTLSSGFITKMKEYPFPQSPDTRKDKIPRQQLLAEHATLSFLCCSIYNKLYNRLLKIEHSLGDGYFCTDSEGADISTIDKNMAENLEKEIRTALESETEFQNVRISRSELEAFFEARGFYDKLGLLKTFPGEQIPCLRYGDYIDYIVEPMSTDKARLAIFNIISYESGIVLRFPSILDPTALNQNWNDPSALFNIFHENKKWAKLIGCDSVFKLNELIYNRRVDGLKWVAEGLHEQKLAKIAKHLVKNFPKNDSQGKRIITIAGPSSSNKTTFALRLAIQLRVNGHTSTVISMDDYYKDRDDIPYGEDGLQDFESITALNIEVLSQNVKKMLKGEKVPERKFDFVSGKGYNDENHKIELSPSSFLIIEGIHGLNPELLTSLGRDKVTPIYISALTPLNLDFNHRFPTSDLRLIRRIIRDYKYRGYSPRKTLQRWTSVRLGEERNIFPFQGNAELFFNSALVYELPVLSIMGKALLAEATIPEPEEDPDSPETREVTNEARRILNLLNFFYPITAEVVPHVSCIREFIGGSDLKY
ncbi:Phosphoribulokinase [Tritrichomonas foetus]|uniref:Phosphoribulokinase n=1 Tax=Tritrichomonas foetus TaxID=1144522 RepID=A0A1J4KNE0_9EUKA|nr:Phosphoribulokinase [Tritrichomonas foetus]|eukprot:OHT12831.1 Phosphoribulokinase [Tritrichomonas foetus]